MAPFSTNRCPCHTGKLYEACCKPYHDGKLPPDPVSLMRSRYAAYARGNIDYIIATTHPQSPTPLRKDIQLFSESTDFVSLEILEVGDDFVVFKAGLVQGGRDVSFTEKSFFEKIHGKWFYLN